MRRRSENRRHRRRISLVRRLTTIMFVTVAVFLLSVGVFALAPLPASELPQASHIYDRNGDLVSQLFEERRTTVPLTDIPIHLQLAVLAVEDERFYRHFGLDLIAVGRAIVRNVVNQRVVEGGSTITQQLAKNLFLSPERTVRRKVLELALTLRLEQNLSKNEILAQYLNTIYLGHGSYGVEEASRTYFGCSVSDLGLSEAALLAGLIKAPERFSPHRNMDAAVTRQQIVLQKMFDLGMITETELATAQSERIVLAAPRPHVRSAPYFVQMVIDELSDVLPESLPSLYRGGLRIFTTLDNDYQNAATAAALTVPITNRDDRGVDQPQLAIVAIDPLTGGVRALVGGRDFGQTQFNRAHQARRQPGSAFKPVVYLAAIDQGFLPTTKQVCEPVFFPTGRGEELYSPKDHGSQPYHYRPMTMREALAISDNVVAVRWIHEVTPATVVEYARRIGISSHMESHLSLALGTSEVTPLEMARAYATLANGGYRVEPHTVLEVQASDGTVLFRRDQEPVRVLRPEITYIITDMLKSVMRRGGTGYAVGRVLGRPSAGKTGSTEGLLDAWFVGYTPELVCAVYVGHDGPRLELPGTGATVAGPVWARFMTEALASTPVSDFTRPDRVRSLSICSESGLLANPTCEISDEVFSLPLIPMMICPTIHDHSGPDEQDPFTDDWPGQDYSPREEVNSYNND